MNAHSAIIGPSVRIADLSDPAECERIDAFVAEHPDSTLFHRPQWSRAIERGCGQKSLYLVAERTGSLTGALPLTQVRSRLFGSALVSVGFATGGGIIADTERTAEAIAQAAWRLAEREGLQSAELRGGPLPEGWTAAEGVYSSFGRALPAKAEELLESIPRKPRAEVRKGLELGLDVSRGSDGAHRSAHYRVYSESVRNLGTPVFPRSLFDSALDLFGTDAEILLISRDGTPLSTHLIFYFKDLCLPYWGGGTHSARTLRGNDMVFFESMRSGLARGCTRVDFGRSKIGTGPWARKRNWGFEETPLVYAVRTATGAAPREVNPLNPKYRLQIAAWQKVPLFLANRIGPVIARGLG